MILLQFRKEMRVLIALLLALLLSCHDVARAQAPVSILIQDDAGSIDFGLQHGGIQLDSSRRVLFD